MLLTSAENKHVLVSFSWILCMAYIIIYNLIETVFVHLLKFKGKIVFSFSFSDQQPVFQHDFFALFLYEKT